MEDFTSLHPCVASAKSFFPDFFWRARERNFDRICAGYDYGFDLERMFLIKNRQTVERRLCPQVFAQIVQFERSLYWKKWTLFQSLGFSHDFESEAIFKYPIAVHFSSRAPIPPLDTCVERLWQLSDAPAQSDANIFQE